MKKTLGIEDKNKKKGGIKSMFGGDKDQEKDKGGIFSFGHDKKKKEEENKKKNEEGGFFSKIFHKDDEDKGKQKKSGFHGLFAEGEGGGAMGGVKEEGETLGEEIKESGGQTVAVTDRGIRLYVFLQLHAYIRIFRIFMAVLT